MKGDLNVFPAQKIPFAQKTSEWKERCVDAIAGKVGLSSVGKQSRKEAMSIAYELYNSNFDKKDFKYITDPLEVGDSFPATPQEFNIIRPKIDLLIGEESKRPENIFVIQTNDEAFGMLQEQKKKMLEAYMYNMLTGGQEEVETPPQIEEFIKKKYKTVAEKQASQTIRYLREKLNMRNEFLKGWKDGLSAAEEIYYSGIINGDPFFTRVNPLECDYDDNPSLEFIEDGDWFVKHSQMSDTEIHDMYYDKMDEDTLDKILNKTSRGSSSIGLQGGDNYKPIVYKSGVNGITAGQNRLSSDKLDVYHVVWRSYQKIGFVKYINEYGDEEELQVDEHYKPEKGEDVEWQWIGQIWEGYKVGSDIYFGIQPVDYIDAAIDSPYRQKLPYTGVIYSNTNSGNKSLINIMKPLYYMYVVVWYRLELMLARDKGKVLNMDITQIPKSMNIDIKQWVHYLSALGINLINPYEEGWDIPGREGGKPASFNQIGSQDLSMVNVIDGYIGLLAKIEDMIGELSGVSKQRQGSISSNELVGNVERSVIQSSHITEPLFWKHNMAKKNSYTMLLNVAKHAWKNSGKKKLHYIFEDGSRVFMDITEDFLYSDIDIFVTDSTKDMQNLQSLRSLLEPAMSAGAGLFDAAEILTTDSISEIKEKLKEIEMVRAQREQQMEQQAQQMQAQIAQMEAEMRQEENRIKEEDSIRKAETQIQVALIGAQAKMANEVSVPEDDGDKEEKKLQLQKEKQDKDYQIKMKQVEETVRKNRVSERQKDEEISIKRKQANKPKTSK